MRHTVAIVSILCLAGPSCADAGGEKAHDAAPVTIGTLPFAIEAPGMYVLADDLTGGFGEHGIVVRADEVTIDLAGHALRGGVGTLSGVLVEGARRGLVVRGGEVSLWGLDAIDARSVRGSRFEDLVLTGNGGHGVHAGDGVHALRCRSGFNVGGAGYWLGSGAVLDDCLAEGNEHGGIRAGAGATLTGCRAVRNVYGGGIVVGEGALLSSCEAEGNLREGLAAGARSQLRDCVARANAGHGVRVAEDAELFDCLAEGTLDGDGLRLGDRAHLVRCRAHGNAGHGIATGDESRLEACVAEGNRGGDLALGEGSRATD